MKNKLRLPVNDRRTVYYASQDPAKIWGEVLKLDLNELKDLSIAMKEAVFGSGPKKWVINRLAALLYAFVYEHWGNFIHESDHIATRVGILSPQQMAFVQRQYTLAHAFCSTTTVWDEERREMVCMRSLDWAGSNEIAKGTRIFDFVNADGTGVAEVAGIAGMVGVLTGVRKGFSVAINYSPWKNSAQFYSDPTFRLRELLQDESVDTYEEALGAVKSWRLGAPCFVTLCGVRRGEACVIEFGAEDQKNRQLHDLPAKRTIFEPVSP